MGEGDFGAAEACDEVVVLLLGFFVVVAASGCKNQGVFWGGVGHRELCGGHLIAVTSKYQDSHEIGDLRTDLAPQVWIMERWFHGMAHALVGKGLPLTRQFRLAAGSYSDEVRLQIDAKRDRVIGGCVAGMQGDHGVWS